MEQKIPWYLLTFYRICGTIGMLLLILCFFFMAISYLVIFTFFKKEKALNLALYINQRIISQRILVPFYFLKVDIFGREHLENCPYVIVSNHQSSLDIVVTGALFPYKVQFLAKKKLERLPLLGFIVKNVCVLVDRSDMRSRVRSFQRMVDALKKDKRSILLYPEGTRNRTKELLQPFHDGAFLLAIKTQTPIVVLTLEGFNEAYPPHRILYLKPRKVKAHWDKPIPTKGLTAKDIPTLKKQVRQLMLGHLEAMG